MVLITWKTNEGQKKKQPHVQWKCLKKELIMDQDCLKYMRWLILTSKKNIFSYIGSYLFCLSLCWFKKWIKHVHDPVDPVKMPNMGSWTH